MKIVHIALALGTLLSVSSAAQTKFVHTSGKEIVDGNGKPLLLRGTNLGNWMVPEGYMWRFEGGPQSPTEIEKFIVELIGPTRAAEFWRQYRDAYITQDDIRAIRAQGFNVIRVPLHWKFFQTDNAEGFRLLDNVVRWSHEAGLYVVLDLHAAPGGQTGANIDDGDGYPWLFRDAGAQQQTVELWKRLARHYANDPTVLGYDLLNEPIPNYPGLEVLNPELQPLENRIGAAIRTVDKHHSLILGGAQWDNNFAVFTPPFDPNTIFTCHRYKAEPNQASLASFIAFRDKYNVPMWMGETGENTDDWVASFRTAMEASNMGWAFWPYKKMEIHSAVATITPPAGWDQIVAYAKLPRAMGLVKERQKLRPPQAVIDAALAGLLQNVRFANCKLNSGYIHALLPDAPQP
jgi:endoglucanase